MTITTRIEQDGFARMQMTIRDGRRESAATGYLHPVLSRENLTVRVNSLVTRVAIEGTRAVGVEYIHEGERASCQPIGRSSSRAARSIHRSC